PAPREIARGCTANFLVSHMAGHMAKVLAAPIEQPAGSDRNFMSEYRTPVAEPLERQAVSLAVLPLAQVTGSPSFQVRTPESRQLGALGVLHSRHYNLLCSAIRRLEEIVTLARPCKRAAGPRLPLPCTASSGSLQVRRSSLHRRVGN